MPITGLILPFDQSTFGQKDRDRLTALQPYVNIVKIGLEAWTAFGKADGRCIGYAANRYCANEGYGIFEDWKLNDIPNTVEGAARNIAARSPAMLTMHASAGPEAIAAVKGACSPTTKLLVVTVLTSLDDPTCLSIFGSEAAHKVVQLAKMGQDSGADGIVCSPKELRHLKEAGNPLLTVIPGIRPANASAGDQKRVMTPGEAAEAGADYIVCGRPIWQAPDPVAAAAAIQRELHAP